MPHLIMWLTVIAVGIPSAWRNPTAFALTFSWLAGEAAWLTTGNNFPLSVYFMADIAVISVIYAKTIRRCGPKVYPSLRDQLRCLVTDPTIWDRLIVAIFLLGAWPLYVLSVSPLFKWWGLWALAILQFLLAFAEAALSFRHDVNMRAAHDPPGNGLALVGYRGNG